MTTTKSWDHGENASRHKRGYGREHVRLRKILLAQEPLCRICNAKGRVTPATIADHIVSIAKGGAIYDLSNMQPVCQSCHNKKTLAEQGKRTKLAFGADGWPVDN